MANKKYNGKTLQGRKDNFIRKSKNKILPFILMPILANQVNANSSNLVGKIQGEVGNYSVGASASGSYSNDKDIYGIAEGAMSSDANSVSLGLQKRFQEEKYGINVFLDYILDSNENTLGGSIGADAYFKDGTWSIHSNLYNDEVRGTRLEGRVGVGLDAIGLSENLRVNGVVSTTGKEKEDYWFGMALIYNVNKNKEKKLPVRMLPYSLEQETEAPVIEKPVIEDRDRRDEKDEKEDNGEKEEKTNNEIINRDGDIVGGRR